MAIANYLGALDASRLRAALSAHVQPAVRKAQEMRYGENPHQRPPSTSSTSGRGGHRTARQLQGKELSYNNIADTDAALECVKQFAAPACVIVKHANPCGVALGRHPARRPTNWPIQDRPDLGLRRHHRLQPRAGRRDRGAIVERQFVEVIIAPAVSAGACRCRGREEERAPAGLRRSGKRPSRASTTSASRAACWCRSADLGHGRRG
jgi:phosphoribosylaminoimidazolecarboxamide formyltransferase/IMP cyclohydrolase